MNLKEVQDRTYELLCLIDDICRKEGITYFLDGGSLIGSVREKDLIAWDDDIDIKMRRDEYPKFKAAMEKNLPEYIRLIEPKDFAPRFYDCVYRVSDTRYLLRKETEEDRDYGNRQNHVCVDVFQHYRVPASAFGRKLARAKMTLIYGLAMGHRVEMDYGKYTPAQRIAVGAMRAAGKLIPAKTTCRWFEKAMDRLDRKNRNSGWMFSNWVPGKTYQKTAWFERAAEGELRGRRFPIPIGYDEDLRTYYGDYMKPPADRSEYIQHLDPEDRYKD